MTHKVEYLTARELTEKLGGVWNEHKGLGKASCPVPGHIDDDPSFEITTGDNGKPICICRSGGARCNKNAIIDALKGKGLWPDFRPNGKANGKVRSRTKLGPPIAIYDYPDAEGVPRLRVTRHPPTPEEAKPFRQHRPDGRGGWTPGAPLNLQCRYLPYRLPELTEAIAGERPVLVLEGEKDCDSAAKLGFVATCNAGGAEKWRSEHAAHLKGADVIIIGDNDEAGRRHVERVAASLVGIAKRIRVVTLPGVSEKGDVSDWIAAGGTAEQLWELVKEAPDWVAPKEPVSEGEDDPSLAKFNAEYAVTRVGGKTRVVSLEEAYGIPGRKIPIYSSFTDFCAFYAHPKKTVTNPNTGQNRQIGIGRWWLDHPQRRQYRGIVYAPNANPTDKLNLWHGFASEPKVGDCSKYLAHLRDNICSGNDEHCEYLLDWMARAVQKPGKPGEVAVVLRGKEGVGKGVAVHGFGRLFGSHYLHITQAGHLTGHFNAHLQNCSVLFADEAFFAGERSHEGILKALITEPTLMIEPKGVDPFAVRNCLHLLLSSNSDWVVPAGADARRFFALTVADTRKQDHRYFAAIAHEMENGGREALLHFLLHRDISGFNVRHVPLTEALADQKAYTRRGIDRLIEVIAHRGYLPAHHHRYAHIAVTAGEEKGQGFYPAARALSPDLKHLSGTKIVADLKRHWECTRGKSGDRQIVFPELQRLRDLFDRRHGPQDWSERNDWGRENEGDADAD